MEKKTIGSFIAALRKAKGLTQKQLAEMLNVSDKAVSRWERDECAPDLSLIPVIAEIFGVTSDEILRGQRNNPTASEPAASTEKSDKQIQRILKTTRKNYLTRSTISIGIAIVGLIAAMICNTGFLRGYVGFGVGSIFYLAGIICQVIFTISALSALDSDEFDPEQLAAARASIVDIAMTTFSVIVILFTATLPLMTQNWDAYTGLTGGTWFCYGILYALGGLVICLLARWIINIRLGYRTVPDMTTPRNKLRVRCAVVLLLVLVVTYIAHGFTYQYLYANLNLISEGTRWDTWEALREYLETPMTPEGEEMTLVTFYDGFSEYIGPDDAYYGIIEDPAVLVYEQDLENPKYEYIRRNLSIRNFYYSNTADHFPIYTYDYEQYANAEDKLLYINLGICVIYIVEIAAAIVIYKRKSKKLNHAE